MIWETRTCLEDQIDIIDSMLGSKMAFDVRVHTNWLKWSDPQFLNSTPISTISTVQKQIKTQFNQQSYHSIQHKQ